MTRAIKLHRQREENVYLLFTFNLLNCKTRKNLAHRRGDAHLYSFISMIEFAGTFGVTSHCVYTSAAAAVAPGSGGPVCPE